METTTYSRFTRTAFDGASEVLSLVKIGSETYGVQITTGPTPDDDFVGLYDVDGEQWNGNADFELVPVAEVPVELVGWEASWDRADCTIAPVLMDTDTFSLDVLNPPAGFGDTPGVPSAPCASCDDSTGRIATPHGGSAECPVCRGTGRVSL